MSKWALYTRYSNENRSYVMSIALPSRAEARAYFMGIKRLSADQFDKIYQIDLMEESDSNSKKGLLFGNQ